MATKKNIEIEGYLYAHKSDFSEHITYRFFASDKMGDSNYILLQPFIIKTDFVHVDFNALKIKALKEEKQQLDEQMQRLLRIENKD